MKLHDSIVDSFLRRLDYYNEEQIFEFVLYLVKKRKEVIRQKETISKLKDNTQEILKLEINNSEDPNIYFNNEELKRIFGNRVNYLSKKYEQKLGRQNIGWKRFFKAIGVKEIPHSGKIIEIASEISEQKFSNENAVRAEKLFRYISKNQRKFNEEEKEKLQRLNEYAWIPTTNKKFEYPNRTYIDKRISYLVENKVSFISFSVRKDNPIIQLLKMPAEPFIEDVVNYLLDHSADINTKKDRRVDYRIYQYLTNKVKIDDESVDKLLNNRIIWFRRKLWYPSKLFLENHTQEFGPNGEIRGYLHKSKLKNLQGFCESLRISDDPKMPDDYVDFLLDISEQAESIEIAKWRKYIKNAYDKIVYSQYPLSEEQKDSLSENRVIIFNSCLKHPSECYLIRETDKICKDRMEKSGIVDVPFILENDPIKERFYLSIGMNEIYDFIFQKRADENDTEPWVEWKEKLDKLIPWINGYGYHAFGDEGLLNLNHLEGTLLQKVSGLKVLYGIEHNGERIVGNPIEDFCCLEMDDNGKHVLYLDKSFDERNNEHVSFLSDLLITLINPNIDVKRVEWIMLMNQYFRYGEISGINPYYPKEIKETSKEVELEESIEEEEIEKETEIVGVIHIPEKDDGLNPPGKTEGKTKRKKRKTSVSPYRGGGYPTPHAINYEYERNWVREQANNFCQVCALFCEDCKVRNVEGQCPCEIRKNAEGALVHHHLEPFEGDSTKDVRGNLIVICNYHHKQLDGVNLKLGYLNDKVVIEERKDDVILVVYPKDKDETELKIKFSKEHFDEFQKYAEKGGK